MNDQTDSQQPSGRLQRNLWKFYVYKGLFGLGFGIGMPILVLYFLDRGISLAQFMGLMSVMNLSLLMFEVPTGIVADKFSRKWSVCAGTLFMGVALLVMLTAVHYLLLIVAFLYWGFGESLVSGADSALLYDSLKADRREEKYHKTVGNAISSQLSATVLGTILCGMIVEHTGLSGPLWVGLGSMLLAAIVASLFKEPPFLQATQVNEKDTSLRMQLSSYATHLKDSVQFLGRNRALIALIFINIVILRLCFLTERPFAQPYLSSFRYGPQQISYFHTIFYGITALSARYSHKVAKVLGDSEQSSMVFIGLIAGVSLCIMANARIGFVAAAAMVGIYLAKGLFMPLMDNSLNRRLTSPKRAACLSIAKMGNNFLGILLGPLFGYLSDVFSLRSSLLIFQYTFVPLILTGLIWGWKTLGQTVETAFSTEPPSTQIQSET